MALNLFILFCYSLPLHHTGLSIAFAIAEQLQCSPATTLFVTHYPQITSLAAMYPNVKNVHMRTSLDTAAEANTGTCVYSILR